MFLKINGIDHELKFGFKFLRSLDELTKDTGDKNLTPLDNTVLSLGSEDVSVLPNLVKAALSHNEGLPKDEEIEAALEEMAGNLEGESLCSVFMITLKSAPLLIKQVKKMADMAEKMAEMEAKMMAKEMLKLENGLHEPDEAATTMESSSKPIASTDLVPGK